MPVVWMDGDGEGTTRRGYFVAIDGEVVIGPFPTRQEAWECENGAQPSTAKPCHEGDGGSCE
jgi:hypothetical protein